MWWEEDEWQKYGSTHTNHEWAIPEAREEEIDKKPSKSFAKVKANGSQKLFAQLQYSALADN